MMKMAGNVKCLTKLNSRFSTVRFSSQLFVSTKLAMDNQTGRPKGFGFVTFKNEADAQDAVKALDGRIVQGRLIFVEFANKSKTGGRHATSDS